MVASQNEPAGAVEAAPSSAPPSARAEVRSPWAETPLWPGAFDRPSPTPSPAAEPEPPAEDDAPDAVGEESASPSPEPPRPVRAAAPASSRLSIALEHGLKQGELRVFVDRERVLEQKLTSRVTKDLLLFKLRSGSVQDVLPVVPGARRVRVEVRTGGETKAGEIAGTFRAGATRRLRVDVGRGGSVSLEWR
jgi:hypothetical protein